MRVERASATGSDGKTKKRNPDGFADVFGTFFGIDQQRVQVRDMHQRALTTLCTETLSLFQKR
jgi:hypothetical protein